MSKERDDFNLVRFVIESNRIEGIVRDPRLEEVQAHLDFLHLSRLDVAAIERLVSVLQPDARLRDRAGLNVRVGSHRPMPSGPLIRTRLEELLAFLPTTTPRANHVAYETLHPFTDGNGRSGRALWLWQHCHTLGGTPQRALQLGFLHAYYYETLAESRTESASHG